MSSPATVQGQKYEAFVGGIGVPDSTEKYVFVPAYQLNLSKNGSVYKTAQHFGTLAAHRAFEQVPHEINLREYRQRITRAIEEADKTSLTPVQISKDLMDQIKELYDRSVDDSTPQGQVRTLKGNIRQIILDSGLFND